MVSNFTCEMLVYDTCIENLKISFTYQIFVSQINLEHFHICNVIFVYEIACEIFRKVGAVECPLMQMVAYLR